MAYMIGAGEVGELSPLSRVVVAVFLAASTLAHAVFSASCNCGLIMLHLGKL